MRLPRTRHLFAGTAAVAAVALAAAADAQSPLPPDLAAKVAQADIAALQKDLPKADKVKMYSLRGTAMMLALYAQKKDDAALRDQALKVAAAIGKKDAKGAKAAADALSSPPAAGGKAADVLKTPDFDIAEAMSPFKKAPRGQNLEADIKAQAKAVTNVELAGMLGVRSALYGEFALAMKPADKAKPGSPEERLWDTSSKEMIALGGEIAAEAAKGAKADKASLKTKLGKLDAACVACHNEFK